MGDHQNLSLTINYFSQIKSINILCIHSFKNLHSLFSKILLQNQISAVLRALKYWGKSVKAVNMWRPKLYGDNENEGEKKDTREKEKYRKAESGVWSDLGSLIGPLTSPWNTASFSEEAFGINKLIIAIYCS